MLLVYFIQTCLIPESGRSKRSGRAGMRGVSDDASSTAASDSTQQTGTGNSTNRSGHRRRRAKRATDGKDGKDFIQRNIDVSVNIAFFSLFVLQCIRKVEIAMVHVYCPIKMSYEFVFVN